MKLSVLRILRESGYDVHGCARGSDNNCYYLISEGDRRDYGDKDGRHFKAVRETLDGGLETGASLSLFMSRSAQHTARVRHIIGDFQEYLVRAGVAYLHDILNGDLSEAPHQNIELNSRSSDEDLVPPPTPDPFVEQQELRRTILLRLYELHSAGTKSISKDALLELLCTQPEWVDRALNILSDQGLLDGALRGEMKLHSKGYLEAEKIMLESSAKKPTGRAGSTSVGGKSNKQADMQVKLGTSAMEGHAFDLFVSYASEDRQTVERLVEVLEARGLKVWWDKGQIRLGDRLSEKINEGLKSSKYGVVIIGASFVAKHWPENELRAMLNRSISSGEKVILPVLLGLTHSKFAAHYPLMADIVTTEFAGDFDQLANEIVHAIDGLPLPEKSAASDPAGVEDEVIEGLAAEIAMALVKECPDGLCTTDYEMRQLLEKFPEHSADEIRDASYDLQEQGLVKVIELINGWRIRLDDTAYEILDPQVMGWSPRDDAVTLAELILDTGEGSARSLQAQLGWSKRRFNVAQRLVIHALPDSCARRPIQPDYVAIGILDSPKCRAALRRFVNR